MRQHQLSVINTILILNGYFMSRYTGSKEVRFRYGLEEVTLPRPFNEDEAFRLSIEQLTDTVMWYRKHFRLPAGSKNKKVFVEFEGVRQGADFYINGEYIGLHENGAMAVGFDLTPYIKYGQENVMAVRIDNNWNYKERATGTKYQWSDRNFNANYGGIPKNVWLHVTDKLYQTLPLYSNLKNDRCLYLCGRYPCEVS